jgi:hypothetical protein
MPTDPHDGGPDDWFVPAADGYPDDWFVPAADGYPDDWFVPATAAPGTAQPTPGPQPGTANPAPTTRPAPLPDPLADFWSRVPASRVGAMAWHPPIFLNSPGQSPLGAPAPLNAPWIDPTRGQLAAAENLPGPSAQTSPGPLPGYGAFEASPGPDLTLLSSPPAGPGLHTLQAPVASAADLGIGNPSTPLGAGAPTDAAAQPSDQVGAGGGDNSLVGDIDQPDIVDLLDQTPDIETGFTPSQIRGALSLFGRYMRINQPEIARIPTDMADMFHDVVTDFPEFLRRSEPTFAGVGLSIPARVAGNVWLLNDPLRGRIAEMVHGRTLPGRMPGLRNMKLPVERLMFWFPMVVALCRNLRSNRQSSMALDRASR